MLKRPAPFWVASPSTDRFLSPELPVWVAGALAVGVCLLTAFGLAMLVERQPLIGDSLGYLHAAQRIAAGFGPTYDDPNNALAGQYFSLYAFQIRRPDTHLMYLGFPPGLSLLLAAPLLFNPHSELVYLVVPLAALAVLALSGWLIWMLTKAVWAPFWAMLLLAVTPELWFFGTAFWSEFPSAAAILGALTLYLLAEIRSRRRWVEVVLLLSCGLLLIYSVFIRYSNIAVVPVFLVADALLLKQQPGKFAVRWPLWLLAGAAVAAMPMLNVLYYGGWNLTSYSPVHGWYPYPAFSPGYAFGASFVGGYSFVAGVETLWRNFGLFLLLAPLGWLRLGRAGGMMAGIALVTFGLYAAYAFAPTGVNARFLIPIFPTVAIGAAVAIIETLQRLPRVPRAVVAVGFVLLALWPLPGGVQAASQRNQDSAAHVALVRAVTADTPADAVFMSYPWNDLIALYGNRSVFNYRRVPVSDPEQQRYLDREAVPTILATISALLEQGKPVYYVDAGGGFMPDLLAILQENFAVDAVVVSGVTLYKLSVDPAEPK